MMNLDSTKDVLLTIQFLATF